MRVSLWLILTLILTIIGGGSGTVFARAVLNEAFCDGFSTGPDAGVPTDGEVGKWKGAGEPLVKVELNEPGAICNDGSPGAMYLRPAPGAPNLSANRWVIHFKGGGGCHSFKSCRERWCGDNSRDVNNPGLMSTAGTHLEVSVGGILSQDPLNPFRNWNHVLLHYCSSDNWMGDHNMGMAVSYHPDDADGVHDHQIAFKGVAIVNAAIGRLLSPFNVTLPNGSYAQMPLLQKADLVLLSGDSAGAHGARMHADRLAGVLRQANMPHGNDLPVLLTLDAAAVPLYDGGVLPWSPKNCDNIPSYQNWFDLTARERRDFWGVKSSNLDQSCVVNSAVDPDHCYDYRYVQKNHITTPMFQRNDLLDSVGKQVLYDLGLVTNERQYVDATNQDLGSIVAPGIENRDDIAVFGPLCTDHISIRNTPRFTQEKAISGGLTYAQALHQWVRGCAAGACPSISEVAPASHPTASTSTCDDLPRSKGSPVLCE